jgi:asparagine synthase (glutamine-hydrolysing)
MESFDKRYLIVFNGEIYNYIEIKEKLLDAGYIFNTDHSDTEVLLNAFIEWGESCLDEIRGMFAFVIYDTLTMKCFIARDRVGQKPFYYYYSDNKFIFSSELNSIVKYEDEKFSLDNESLYNYLQYGYVPHPKSIFTKVHKLPPANCGWVDLSQKSIEIKEYWKLNIDDLSIENPSELIESEIERAVLLRLRADVPIGAFISGGIDSTLIVQKASALIDGKLDMFGADFPQEKFSEKKYMTTVSEKYPTRLFVRMIDENNFSDFEKMISIFDEPFDGGSSIALFGLFSLIKNKKKIILTGDGGDEIFSGYSRYCAFLRRMYLFNFIQKARVILPFLRMLNALGLRSQKLSTILNIEKNGLVDDYMASRYNSKLPVLMKEKIPPQKPYRDLLKNKKVDIKTIQFVELKTILPGRMLYKLDRISMYFGIEARSPLLDHEIIEKAFSTPSQHMITLKDQKKVLKGILRKDFGSSFIERKKTGFGNPVEHWFKTLNPDEIFKHLKHPSDEIFKYLSFEKTHKNYPQINHGYDGSNTSDLWRLVILSRYLHNYKDFIVNGNET